VTYALVSVSPTLIFTAYLLYVQYVQQLVDIVLTFSTAKLLICEVT